MSKLNIPDRFAEGIITDFGKLGREWLDTILLKLESYCERWNLVVDGKPTHGHLSLVIPVLRRNEECVLKIAWIDENTQHEVVALQVWNGQGVVKLLDSNPKDGVQLLERLNFNKTLNDIDVNEAVIIASRLLRRLAIPAPKSIPKLKDQTSTLLEVMTKRWQKLDKPIPKDIFHKALEIARYLATSSNTLLVNHDLHYGNVLASEREPWLVIDPKVISGDIEYGLFPLVLRRLEEVGGPKGLHQRFAGLIEKANLDAQKAYDWTLVRCTDYWLWALSMKFTKDPKRCEVIAKWLLENRTEGVKLA